MKNDVLRRGLSPEYQECTHRVVKPWLHGSIYLEAVKWMADTDAGYMDSSLFLLFFNEVPYHDLFVFKHESDKLLFCLRFPELL